MQAPLTWNRPALAATAAAGAVFVAIAQAALEQIAANAAGAAAGRDPEYLHQLRVGVRRLRCAIRTFRALLRRRDATAIDKQWGAIMQTLGSARDADVLQRALNAGDLRLMANRRRAEAQLAARAFLKSPCFRQAQLLTSDWARKRPWRRHADAAEPLARFAPAALQRLYKGLCEAADGIDWRDAARRHRLRIRVKRMRYGCNFLASAFAHRRTRVFLDGLHTLQDILGELNDIQVLRALLRTMVPRGSARRILRAAAAVRAQLTLRERALIAGLVPAWAAFAAQRRFWRRRKVARA